MAVALADVGFEVEIGQHFVTPDVAAARSPDIVGVSTLAGAHLR
ncbi:hypothetical protein [Paraburkholderia caffeinitolerans]